MLEGGLELVIEEEGAMKDRMDEEFWTPPLLNVEETSIVLPRRAAAKVIKHENESKVLAARKAVVHADQAERREHSEG